MCVHDARRSARATATAPATGRTGAATLLAWRNREEWLLRAADALVGIIARKTDGAIVCGRPYISVGVPVRSSKAIGQCWDGARSTDGRAHIFIHAALADPVEVLGVLVHELLHEGVGCKHGHRKPFSQACVKVGLVKPWTATTPGPELAAELTALAQSLGEYPHAALDTSSNRKKKTQPTRMLKFQCPSCESIVRSSNPDAAILCVPCDEQFVYCPREVREDA